ncbi:Translation initiation factor eIF3 subunit [Raphanus sativus]|nr:Translation initiation factor eIF3 subunit [Raphanus sativus]
MDDWEDEPLAPLPAKVELKSNWNDEDVDENDIKDSWEDDDDDDEPAPVKPASDKAPPKKAAAKAVEKKGKAADVPKEAPKEGPLDPISKKLRMQGEKTKLDVFIPKSESDFLEYAEMISHRLKPYELSLYCATQSSHETICGQHEGADVKDVASSITAIANEKIRRRKNIAAGRKKTGGKKKQLIVDKANRYYLSRCKPLFG